MATKDSKAQVNIAMSAAEAVKVISAAANEATKVIAAVAAEAAKINSQKGFDDHDTLVKLVGSVSNLEKNVNEKFLDIKNDIKGINDGTGSSISDHEERLRFLEKEAEDHALVKKVVYGAVAFILLAVLSSIVYLVIKK